MTVSIATVSAVVVMFVSALVLTLYPWPSFYARRMHARAKSLTLYARVTKRRELLTPHRRQVWMQLPSCSFRARILVVALVVALVVVALVVVALVVVALVVGWSRIVQPVLSTAAARLWEDKSLHTTGAGTTARVPILWVPRRHPLGSPQGEVALTTRCIWWSQVDELEPMIFRFWVFDFSLLYFMFSISGFEIPGFRFQV